MDGTMRTTGRQRGWTGIRTGGWAGALLAAAGLLLLTAGSLPAGEEEDATVIYATDFADGAEGWDAIHQAEVSDVARREGGKSLLIKQWEKGEDDSAWLSPVLEDPGAPVRISVWAADNYLETKDFSFSAAFELVPCDADGKLTGAGGDWTYIPWESERYIPQFRHTFTKEGLVWEHYTAVKRAPGKHFRVRFSYFDGHTAKLPQEIWYSATLWTNWVNDTEIDHTQWDVLHDTPLGGSWDKMDSNHY